MVTPIFIIFAVVSLLYLTEQEYKEPNLCSLIVLLGALLVVSTNRPVAMADAVNYINNFERLSQSRFEPAYQLLRDVVVSFTSSYKWLFAMVCTIALITKFLLIYRVAPYIYGALLVYLSYSFVLHDMIQIRAGVATGFLLFAIKEITERRLTPFLILSFAAISFHYSTMVILPLWFIGRLHLKRNLWLAILPLSYLLMIVGATSFDSVINHIPIRQVQYLLEMYRGQMASGVGVEIDIFNLLTLLRVAICTTLIIYVDRIEEHFDHFRVWLMIYTLSIVIFIMLSTIPVLAFRLSELLQVTEIIVIPTLVYALKNRVLGKLAVIFISFTLLSTITFVNEYLL